MESAITEAFLQTVRGLVQKCMEDTDLEARKYALVMKTLYGAAAQVPVAPDARRIEMLEGTIDSLVQEIGTLDTRLNEIEQNSHDTWNGLGGGAAEPLGQDEVIDVEEPIVVVKEVELAAPIIAPPVALSSPIAAAPVPMPAPAPAPEVIAPVPVPAPAPAPAPAPEFIAAAPAPVPVPAPAPAPVAAPVAAPAVIDVAPAPAPVAAPAVIDVAPAPVQEEEEEEEENPLEEITVDGKTYYKDEENLVYALNEDGDLDDTPIGRYMTKTQKIRHFPKTEATL